MDKIRGYKITGEVAASSARLYFAKRWGKRYVLKEFRHYRFPVEESEACPPMLSHVEQRTQAFYDRLQHQAQYVRKRVREDGLLNVPLEVFRQGKMIYKVTRQIDDCGIGTSELHEKLTPRQMAVLLRSILLQLQSLERIGFIHGDMKPENVVVTCFGKTYVGSVIDFDTGYIAVEGPGECVEFTPEYASPEMHLMESLIALPEDDDNRIAAVGRVTGASDVYAAGCVFAHMLTGSAWMVPDKGAGMVPPGQQMLSGYAVQLPPLHPVWRTLLRGMTAADPIKRLSPMDAADCLSACMAGSTYRKLADPFAWTRPHRPARKNASGTERLRMMRDAKKGCRVLAAFQEDCWQLPGPMLLKPRAARNLQRRHKENLAALRSLAQRLGKLDGLTGAVSPFRVVKKGCSVFAMTDLPKGERLGLKGLYASAKPEEIDDVMIGLLRDIDRCHRDGMVHGTIAPDSVDVIDDSDALRPVLTDAWRLKLLRELPHGALIDADPELLAPEMHKYMTAADDEASEALREMIGSHTDVFSLGLVYHMMLTGEKPQCTDPGCTCCGMAAELGALRLSGKLDKARAAVIGRMIAYEPGERPATCADAADMIAAIRTEAQQPKPAPRRTVPEAPRADTAEAPAPRPKRRPPARPDPAPVLAQPMPAAFMDDDDESLWAAGIPSER